MKELKLIRKDKRSFIFLLLMPAIFIVMFGTIANSGSGDSSSISLHVIDQEQSAASKAFVKQMGGIMDVKADAPDSLNDQIGKIKKGQLSAVLVIPQGFEAGMKQGKQTEIQLYQDPSAQMQLAPINAILNAISGQYRDQKLQSTLMAMGQTKEQAAAALASPIAVKPVATTSDHFNYLDLVVPGMTVMFVFFIMITMTRRFFDEKKTGLLSRIRSTNIKPMDYLIGMWIPFLLTIIAQCAVLFAFGHFLYHLKLGDLSALAFIVLGLAIAGSGMGLGLSFIVPGESAAMVITQIISTGGAFVGGLWTPSYMMPQIVQNIGHFTPQFWAQRSLTDIISHGAHIGDVLLPFAVLVLFGLAGITVAFFRLPGFLRSAAN